MKNVLLFELDCLKGTKDLVKDELKKLGEGLEIFNNEDEESVIFLANEDYEKLKSLKRAVNIYYLLCFPVKGPGNLLNIKHMSEICLHMQKASKNSLDKPFKTFRINAPGGQSQTYKDIIKQIEHYTGFSYDRNDGEALIRFRKSSSKKIDAWEVLIRISSKNLSSRFWRTQNFKGALNPIIANIMYDLACPKKNESMINVMCGSGTILIESAMRRKLSRIVGVDNDDETLNICKEHILNSKRSEIEVYNMDARNLSFGDGEFDLAFCDFPWGENIGKREDNLNLYTKSLKELIRVTKKDARFSLISQDIKNLEHALKSLNLKTLHRRKVYQGGFFPEIFIVGK